MHLQWMLLWTVFQTKSNLYYILSPPQSFGLSSLKPQAAGLERLNMGEGSYGVPNILTCG